MSSELAYPDLLMSLLSIPSLLNNGHNDVLSGHERELLGDAAGNDLRIHDEPLRDILERGQNNISGQEGFRKRNPSVSA